MDLSSSDLTLTLILWTLCTLGAYFIAERRGATNATMWAVAGLLLGPIGVLWALLTAKGPKQPA